jgi:hypothetical protein
MTDNESRTAKHPARFSKEILEVLRIELASAPWVHDPFAGTGERLGALCDELGVGFSGTELEAPFIVDGRVKQGDSRDPEAYPVKVAIRDVGLWPSYWIVTSPVYPNGVADHFRPKCCDQCDSKGAQRCPANPHPNYRRMTYRTSLMEIMGDNTVELNEANMGRYSYRGGAKKAAAYWRIATEVAAQWSHAERAIVNVKDFVHEGQVVPLAEMWESMLTHGHDWQLIRRHDVECPGMLHGANRGARIATEAILVFTRS